MLRYQIQLRWKVLSAFVLVNLFIGLIFAWTVSRPTLQDLWFHRREYWLSPTLQMLLLASGLFWLNLAGACLIAHMRSWLSFSTFRLIVGLIMIATLPLLVWLIEPLPIFLQFILFRSVLVVLLTVTLWVITRQWYWGIAGLILAVSLATPLLGNLPSVVIRPLSAEWFEISEFCLGSLLLSALFGFWLVKGVTSHKTAVTQKRFS